MTEPAPPTALDKPDDKSVEAKPDAANGTSLLKLALEIGPLALFFFANARAGLIWGT